MAHPDPGGRALSSSPPSDAVGAPGALAIVGVTATGKSAVALAIARRLGNAEIISVDSMQVYREMDVGTDKPPAAVRAEVPHHLIDVADPSEDYSLTMFQAAARQARADIADRGPTAVLVGGTGLYHRAVIDDLEIPGRYPEAAAALEQEPDTEALHRRLVELDSLAASRMESTNRRRIVRALEVTVGSGRPFSSYGPGLGQYPPCNIAQIGLSLSRSEIDHRIEKRYYRQMEAGFLAEVEALADRHPPLSRTASQALGYKELLGHLNGAMSLDEALALAITRTRRFARRQERWFRRDPRIVWLNADDEAESLADEALFRMTQHGSQAQTEMVRGTGPRTCQTGAMQLAKHHGLGNDFLVAWADALPADAPAMAEAVCHRTRGVGADGLIFGLPGDTGAGTDVTMVLFNADGSRAEMSGNGIRCLAQAFVQHDGRGTNRKLSIGTDAGIRTVSVESTADLTVVQARVDMGPVGPGPNLADGEVAHYLRNHGFADHFFTADVGNPHLVVGAHDIQQIDVARSGSELSRLAGGINVEFISATATGIDMRVWERGVGVTEACGTGACAAAQAAHHWGLVGTVVSVSMPGGDVVVNLGDTAVLAGPSQYIATVDCG